MKEKIDWSKIEEESELYLKKSQFVEEQIKKDRKECPEKYDLKKMAKEVNEVISQINPFEKVLELEEKPNKDE